MPFEMKFNNNSSNGHTSKGAPSYEEEATGSNTGDSHLHKLTPREYPHSGDPNNIPPSYRSAAYNHQYWDGHSNQWQYYNPSSEYYGRYYPPPDPYYRRDYDPYAAAQGYPYAVQYPYPQNHPHHPPEVRTPTMNIHSAAAGSASSAPPNGNNAQDQHSYPRSPKRIRIDPINSSAVTNADISSAYTDSHSKNQNNSEGLEDTWKTGGGGGPRYSSYESSMAEIEPAPLASSVNDHHYGHIYTSSSSDTFPTSQQQMDHNVPHSSSSSSTKRSLSYIDSMQSSYYPNTPYQQQQQQQQHHQSQEMDVKPSFEADRHSGKTFVTPEHMSGGDHDHASPNHKDVNHDHMVHPLLQEDHNEEDLHGGLVIPSPTSSTRSERYHGDGERNRKSTTTDSTSSSATACGGGTKRPVTDRKQLQSKAWYERFNDLKAYKEKHGDCLVPQKYPPNPSLGIWVNKQRMEYKLLQDNEKSSMSEDRLASLKSIGFVWAKRKGQATWDTKFKQLLEYKAKHGDCLIPTKYSKNPALGRWVSTQREQYRMWKSGNPKSKMTVEKARMLDEIGFVWRLQF